MKNTFSYILFCLLFINNTVYAFEQDFVITKAMDIIYDDTKKQFISKKDEKNKAIEVIFNKQGDILKLGNKTIMYNNGKIVRIGKSYLTYLNGKIYTVGNENVYLNERGDSITKIGNTSIQKYFTGEEVSYNDIKNIPYGGEMTFYLNADGTGFGGSNSGIYIPFEDTEIVEIETKNINNGFFTKNGNIKKIGDKTIKYNLNGEILKIGDEGVSYNSSNKISAIGNKSVIWDNENIKRIGDYTFSYDKNNNLQSIYHKEKGFLSIWTSFGKIQKINNITVEYE